MSKTLDEKQKFIELRAKGYSYQKISDELNISKPTLLEWSKNDDVSRDIQNQRTLILDDLQEQYAITKKHRIILFGDFLNKAKDELQKRDLSTISTDKLVVMIMKLSETLKNDEVELNILGDMEIPQFSIAEQTTCKI